MARALVRVATVLALLSLLLQPAVAFRSSHRNRGRSETAEGALWPGDESDELDLAQKRLVTLLPQLMSTAEMRAAGALVSGAAGRPMGPAAPKSAFLMLLARILVKVMKLIMVMILQILKQYIKNKIKELTMTIRLLGMAGGAPVLNMEAPADPGEWAMPPPRPDLGIRDKPPRWYMTPPAWWTKQPDWWMSPAKMAEVSDTAANPPKDPPTQTGQDATDGADEKLDGTGDKEDAIENEGEDGDLSEEEKAAGAVATGAVVGNAVDENNKDGEKDEMEEEKDDEKKEEEDGKKDEEETEGEQGGGEDQERLIDDADVTSFMFEADNVTRAPPDHGDKACAAASDRIAALRQVVRAQQQEMRQLEHELLDTWRDLTDHMMDGLQSAAQQ